MRPRPSLLFAPLLFAAACSSPTVPASAIPGRYAIRAPQLAPNGVVTITADTLVLGADGSATHSEWLVGRGIVPYNRDIGRYAVDGSTVVFTWTCYGNACSGYGEQTTTATLSAIPGRVWRLVHVDQGLTETFYRVIE
ncbi:MAG: hypothetical protein ACJ79K_15855 [Gemmatimonadaceae bacterium]